MPTLSAITVSQPSWLQEELRAIAENEQVSYLLNLQACVCVYVCVNITYVRNIFSTYL